MLAALLPLAAALALGVAPVQQWLRERGTPDRSAACAILATAGYIALLGSTLAETEHGPFTLLGGGLLAAGLPFLFWLPLRQREGREESITWFDLLFGLAVLGIVGERLLRLKVPIGLSGGTLFQADATFHLWVSLLAVYLVLVRGLDIGYSFRFERLDWTVTWRLYACLILVILPVAALIGFVPLTPVWKPFPEFLGKACYYVLHVALGEELFFRGVVQNGLVRIGRALWGERSGPVRGLVVASIVFGLCHIGKGPPIYVVFAAIAGLGYGTAYMRTGRLTSPVLIHGALDLSHYMFRPF